MSAPLTDGLGGAVSSPSSEEPSSNLKFSGTVVVVERSPSRKRQSAGRWAAGAGDLGLSQRPPWLRQRWWRRCCDARLGPTIMLRN